MRPIDFTRMSRALDNNYVLILNTNGTERKAVAERLRPSAKVKLPVENDGARLGICADQLVLQVTGTSGGQADKAVGRITRNLLKDRQIAKPKAVILLGIGWGAPNNGAIGTTLLCGDLLAVNHMRFDGDQPRRVPVARHSPWLNELDEIASEIKERFDKSVRVGVLASGEQFLSTNDARDILLTSFPHVAGGEMEGWDLVPDLGDIPWLQLRGISDFGGDGTDRFHQVMAAHGAAELMAPLLHTLQARELLTPIRRDPATVGLIEALAGRVMEIADPTDGIGRDEHLNDRLGPSLIWRLAQYDVGADTGFPLPRLLTNLILEIAQNALKHGGASQASVAFDDTSITYSDDGDAFDLFSLPDIKHGRGGRTALSDVQNSLMANQIIDLVAEPADRGKGNRYRFSFLKLSARLRRAREQCVVEFSHREYETFSGTADERLRYDPECETLFFDARDLLMSSRRHDSVDELRPLLASGKELFIQCASEHEKAYYEDSLSDVAGDRLTVLVTPVALAGRGRHG